MIFKKDQEARVQKIEEEYEEKLEALRSKLRKKEE